MKLGNLIEKPIGKQRIKNHSDNFKFKIVTKKQTMAIFKRQDIISVDEDVEKREPLYTTDENIN